MSSMTTSLPAGLCWGAAPAGNSLHLDHPCNFYSYTLGDDKDNVLFRKR